MPKDECERMAHGSFELMRNDLYWRGKVSFEGFGIFAGRAHGTAIKMEVRIQSDYEQSSSEMNAALAHLEAIRQNSAEIATQAIKLLWSDFSGEWQGPPRYTDYWWTGIAKNKDYSDLLESPEALLKALGPPTIYADKETAALCFDTMELGDEHNICILVRGGEIAGICRGDDTEHFPELDWRDPGPKEVRNPFTGEMVINKLYEKQQAWKKKITKKKKSK